MNTTINTLDKKFTHHSWFKNSGLTKRKAIEYFASCGDFRLSKKVSKIQSDNLFDPTIYDNVIEYCGRTRSTYKITEEEKEYFLQRENFWNSFKIKMNQEYTTWGKDANYDNWLDFEREEKMKVKEYADYITAYKKSV